MKKVFFVIAFLVSFSSFSLAQNCADNAKIIAPVLSEEARKIYETKLAEAKKDFEKNPNKADSIIWLGRRTAYLGNYKEAIKIFTDGIGKFPKDVRFYRHRGHRFVTIRCFDDAVRDLKTAQEMIRKYKIRDEVEPDGLPNARNVPTSSLWSNIHYHLGLAYYFKREFNYATAAFMASLSNSKHDDMRVASAHWAYMSARRFTKIESKSELDKVVKELLIKGIEKDPDIIESVDYYKLVKLYQGKIKADELLKEIGTETSTLSNASLGYGLANWFLYNGEKEKAEKIFRQITSGNQWASFGYIAAEMELK